MAGALAAATTELDAQTPPPALDIAEWSYHWYGVEHALLARGTVCNGMQMYVEHWIPAQVVGPPWFGEITEYRPIFQKGDRFYDPFQKTYVRYVPQTVRGYEGKVPPKVEFRHEVIADSDINGPSYSNSK